MSDNINLFDLGNNDDNNHEDEMEEISSVSREEDDYLINGGFEINDEYVEEEYDEYEEIPQKRRFNKKGFFKTLIWIVAMVAVAAGIAWGAVYLGADYLGIGFGRGSNVEITIPEGAGTKQIAEILKEEGVVKSPLFFRVFSKLKGYDGKYQSGTRVIDSEAGYDGIAVALTKKGVARKSARVTIIEGWDIDEICAELEKNGVCTADDFKYQMREGDFDYDFISDIPVQSVHYRLEGYLFPDTYDFLCYEDGGFTSKECAYFAIDKMLQNLDNKVDKKLKKQIDESKYTFHEILAMASIVEMEAGSHKDEMANVAAVFFNRLESRNFTTLGSSPTHHYPYGDGRYDTNYAQGIPPGPMCSPSIAAIKACINPTQNFDYYYFVTDKSMKFYYNKTLAQHNSTVAKLKAQGNWIYEYWD